MSASEIISWIYATPMSTAIRDVLWVIPTVQSVHIIAITVLFGSALVSDLRLAGLFASDEPLRSVVRRYYPWMRNALLVLLLTGLVLVIAEPDRVLKNSTFWIKMGLVVCAFAITRLLRRPLLRPALAGPADEEPGLGKAAAWLSIGLWCVVIFCGRWIAYTI
ncbi:DUF6644 family protein [Pseudomonas sp. KNUC1026]|uniref:DUF6644 family protein n=1 Tax=Pseudomonas sp. KNUC1026 TaxID=2893890 RepID=UPI001F2679F5|nr:DUF6644 family protein [Pseudomonas sp. KNUC1026]UFH50391.1 hypothetical protein LN139_03780 [Pseudomonas sp. KNUC1026]